MTETRPTLGFALCGSFCTFARVIPEAARFVGAGFRVLPILSETAAATDTRFGRAADFAAELERLTGEPVIRTLAAAEPIGPKKLLDALLIAPCTGNTLAKLAAGIADGPVTLAAKSHLRNGRPVVVAVSSNDGLAANAASLGALLNRRHYYFVPFGQDDPQGKPRSLVADMTQLLPAVQAALRGEQLQPLLLAPGK